MHPPTCDCLSRRHVFSPRADNNAATVRPPIPPPTTTTSYALMTPSLLENVFVDEAAQNDEDRLNAVENEVDYKGRKDFTTDCARHRQGDAQQRYNSNNGDVVAVLKDVHACEQQRHNSDCDAHSRRFFECAIEQAAVDHLFD